MDLLDSPIMANESGKKVFIMGMNEVNDLGNDRFFEKEKEVKPKINYGMVDSFMGIFGYTRVVKDE